MKKYIDMEWLENNAKEYSLGYYEEDEWATPLNILDSAPSIDIVRCKECKYKRINEDDETRYYYCALEDRPNRQWSVDDTDYCSWGEVRDEQMD